MYCLPMAHKKDAKNLDLFQFELWLSLYSVGGVPCVRNSNSFSTDLQKSIDFLLNPCELIALYVHI